MQFDDISLHLHMHMSKQRQHCAQPITSYDSDRSRCRHNQWLGHVGIRVSSLLFNSSNALCMAIVIRASRPEHLSTYDGQWQGSQWSHFVQMLGERDLDSQAINKPSGRPTYSAGGRLAGPSPSPINLVSIHFPLPVFEHCAPTFETFL